VSAQWRRETQAALRAEIALLAAARVYDADVEIRAGSGDTRTVALEGPRAKAKRMMEEHRNRPSLAATHEAAHEAVASARGFRNVAAFVRDRESGVTYFETTPRYTHGVDGRRRFDCRATLRAKAAVSLAGYIAEAILEGREVPDCDALFRAEAASDDENPLLPFVAAAAKHETDGDVARAAKLVGELVDEARMETIFDLRSAWPQIVRRARQLDARWKESA